MDNKKVLLGESFPIPELDPEENEKRAVNAFKRYVFLDIIDSMGQEDFETVYTSSQDVIKQTSNRDKAFFGYELLDKVEELYGYEFPYRIDLTERRNIQDTFKFIEFVEFDHIAFLADIWKEMSVDIRVIDIENFARKNADQIVTQVELHLDDIAYSQLINLFLRTINKEDLIEFIIVKTSISKMDIVLEILQGEENDFSEQGNNQVDIGENRFGPDRTNS